MTVSFTKVRRMCPVSMAVVTALKRIFSQLSKTLWQLTGPGPLFSTVSPVSGGGPATAPLPAVVSTSVYLVYLDYPSRWCYHPQIKSQAW